MKSMLFITIYACVLWACYESTHEQSAGTHVLDSHISDMFLDQSFALDMAVVRSAGSLATPFDWQTTDESQDPFQNLIQQDQVSSLSCDINAHGVEEVSVGVWTYSIATDQCHWLTIKQAVLRPVRAGDHVELKVWHFTLNAPQRAVAHVGLATDHELLILEEEVIPQEARMLKIDAIFKHDLQVGDWIYFHLDNHGANSWHILEIELVLDD